MVESPHRDLHETARRLYEQASADEIRVTVHGHQEMKLFVDEALTHTDAVTVRKL